MSKIRIYELAKELDIPSKNLIESLEQLGLGIHSHMSSINEEEAELLRELLNESPNSNEDDEFENISTDFEEVVDTIKNKKNGNNKKVEKHTNEEVEGNHINENNLNNENKIIEINEDIIVKDLADLLNINVSQVISKLIGLGIMASQNQTIDSETASLIANEFGITLSVSEKNGNDDEFELDFEDKEENLKSRPPVVTVMGHVDHGKTSLLDAIKHSNVIGGEAGGITQHIGAYTVNVNNKKVTFLDTPGHEAFTSMRARGARVTDIAILVVAADDGVMPQTIEAIAHAKAARVPIIVAINKIDKPDANIDRIKQELVENGLVPEDWGGDTITVPISAKQMIGIEDILEMILLVAEMQELKANPDRNAVGTIIEAQLDKGRGPVATVLIQKGTLSVGDLVVSGTASGKIRAMFDDKGKKVKKVTPAIPVMILGLSEVPNAGELLYAVDNEKIARVIADSRRNQIREKQIKNTPKVSLDDLFERIKQGEIKDLNIILKGDVKGSIEALTQSLVKLDTEEVRINIIHSGAGGITENDIMLASASNAIVIGFNVRPNLNALEVAKSEDVDIRTYRVIYEAIEDIKAAVKGMHAPKFIEEVLGRAQVRATFRLPTGSTIAGIYVQNGKIQRNANIRLIRDDIVKYDGKISSLKRFKDDAREVAAGFEAGLGLENYNDIRDQDIIEAYIIKEVEKK